MAGIWSIEHSAALDDDETHKLDGEERHGVSERKRRSPVTRTITPG